MDTQKTWLAWLRKDKSAVALLVAGVLIFFGIIRTVLVFGPIAQIEAKYQYRQLLAEVGANSLFQLVVPQITFSQQASTQHREFGIVIPAIGLNEPVIFNVDATNPALYNAALQEGIAHAASTSIPDMGGIGYYFAHSSNPQFRKQFNAVFYLLGKLKGGEDIYIWHEGERYQYRVTTSRVTAAADVSFLGQEYPAESIVLQTCWPPGTTSKRLLVFGERVLE